MDDVWVNPTEELIVVDYKATGANQYQIYPGYKRQMEIYQWLLVQNGYKVSKTGYFLFAKVNKEGGFSEGKLSFNLTLESLEGDNSWIEEAILGARKTIDNPIPAPKADCEHCQYVKNSCQK